MSAGNWAGLGRSASQKVTEAVRRKSGGLRRLLLRRLSGRAVIAWEQSASSRSGAHLALVAPLRANWRGGRRLLRPVELLHQPGRCRPHTVNTCFGHLLMISHEAFRVNRVRFDMPLRHYGNISIIALSSPRQIVNRSPPLACNFIEYQPPRPGAMDSTAHAMGSKDIDDKELLA